MPRKKRATVKKEVNPEIVAHKETLNSTYEFVGSLDYIKKLNPKFGEEVIGRRCLVLFDVEDGSSNNNNNSSSSKNKNNNKKSRPKRMQNNNSNNKAALNRKPIPGKVVAYKAELVNEEERNPELFEVEYLHRINFDDEEEDEEDAPEWWMDLAELRDQGLLFWQDAAVERVAVARKDDKSKEKNTTTTESTEAETKVGDDGTPAAAADAAAVKQQEETIDIEALDLPSNVTNPQFEIGDLVFWHLIQPPKPGEIPEPVLDPEGMLTELPQPTGLDMTGTVQALPSKSNGYRYEISLPGSTNTGTIMLPPSAVWAVEAPDKPKKKRKRSTSAAPRQRKKVTETGPPWVDSLAVWLVSVPAENSSKGANAKPVTKKSAALVVSKARKLATGKGISYGRWLANAVDDDEHSRNLTVFYYKQPITLQTFDYETIKSDGMAHELLYGEDQSGGWLYSYVIEKIHMFQEYCKKHSLDLNNLPMRWQDFPGGQEPPKEEPKKSPKKKSETDGGDKGASSSSNKNENASTADGGGNLKPPPKSTPESDVRKRSPSIAPSQRHTTTNGTSC